MRPRILRCAGKLTELASMSIVLRMGCSRPIGGLPIRLMALGLLAHNGPLNLAAQGLNVSGVANDPVEGRLAGGIVL